MDAGTTPPGFWKMKSWSPYIVGAAIGILSWVAFATVNKPIRITTALTAKAAAPTWAQQHSYYPAKVQEGKAATAERI